MERKKTIYAAGIGYVLLAAGLNGFLPLMVTTVYESGGHFTNIMFYKGLIVAPIAYMICRFHKMPVRITIREHITCAAIALFQFVTSLLLYGSYNLISTGMATTLHFMYPVAVVFLAAVFFHERPCRWDIVSLIFCIGGVILLCSTAGESELNFLGIPIALLSGMVYAGYILLIGKSSASALPSMIFTLYVFLYNGIFSGIVSGVAGTLTGLTNMGWVVMAVSALAAGVVTVAMQRGIGIIGSQTASILSVAEPLVSVLIGVIFLSESFTVRSACGTCCVIIAAILATLIKNPPSPPTK